LHPDEVQFVTPELIEASCIVGQLDELVEKVGDLEAAGLDQIMVLPSFAARYQAAEEVGTLIKRLG
ncbi:MAG: alkanesulfonate monooxygenase SsuD, partial [Candidatus Poriferisodalaceae bacterium]